MIKKYLYYCLLNMICGYGFSQSDSTITVRVAEHQEIIRYHLKQKDPSYIEDMATDRPHQTETASIIPVNHFQFESGMSREITKASQRKEIESVYNSLLLKCGIGNGMDLRASVDFLKNELFHEDSLLSSVQGFSGIALGGKKFLVGEKGFRPKISLLGELYLPYFGKKEFRPSYTGATIRFLFEHNISKRMELEYNIGPDWNGNTPNVSYFYAASLTYQLKGPLSLYGELFGYFTESPNTQSFKVDSRMDGGFVYLLKKNIQLDLEGGIGLSRVSPDYFIATGISVRIPN